MSYNYNRYFMHSTISANTQSLVTNEVYTSITDTMYGYNETFSLVDRHYLTENAYTTMWVSYKTNSHLELHINTMIPENVRNIITSNIYKTLTLTANGAGTSWKGTTDRWNWIFHNSLGYNGFTTQRLFFTTHSNSAWSLTGIAIPQYAGSISYFGTAHNGSFSEIYMDGTVTLSHISTSYTSRYGGYILSTSYNGQTGTKQHSVLNG